VAVVSNYLPSGSKIGVGYWVDQYCRALCARGHQVTVFSTCPPVPGAPYRTEQLPLEGSLRTFRFALALRKVDFSGFDVLHAHGDDQWLVGRRFPPHVRTMQGSCLSEATRITGAKERLRMVALGLGELLSTAVADKTVVISPATRRMMPWVHEVVPDGVDLARFARPADLPRAPVPTVLFVGTYRQRKRGALLVEQFCDVVRPALPEAELWMVCEDAPARPGVVPLGRLSDAELVDRYHRAWAFCLPSSYEGLGLPYVEALAASLPVVATPNSGARFVLDEGRAGVLCADEELGRSLVGLLGDPERRRALAVVGRDRAAAFALSATVERYEALFDELLAPAVP
jgi:glycosyltransferase involved in cell wall biosynthesis